MAVKVIHALLSQKSGSMDNQHSYYNYVTDNKRNMTLVYDLTMDTKQRNIVANRWIQSVIL